MAKISVAELNPAFFWAPPAAAPCYHSMIPWSPLLFSIPIKRRIIKDEPQLRKHYTTPERKLARQGRQETETGQGVAHSIAKNPAGLKNKSQRAR
ncbi:MAG: hypothetical protein WCG36_05480 [bacterium]